MYMKFPSTYYNFFSITNFSLNSETFFYLEPFPNRMYLCFEHKSIIASPTAFTILISQTLSIVNIPPLFIEKH